MKNCPNCGAGWPAGAAECPGCGLLLSKWKERGEREKREAEAVLAQAESSPPPKRIDPWIGRSVAAALVMLYIAGLSVWVYRSMEDAASRRRREETEQRPAPVDAARPAPERPPGPPAPSPEPAPGSAP